MGSIVISDRLRKSYDLELTPEGLKRYAHMPEDKQCRDDVAKALRWAAEQIEQQQRLLDRQTQLIGDLKSSLQPVAAVALTCRGSDDEVVVDRRGPDNIRVVLRNRHLRQARKAWSTKAA